MWSSIAALSSSQRASSTWKSRSRAMKRDHSYTHRKQIMASEWQMRRVHENGAWCTVIHTLLPNNFQRQVRGLQRIRRQRVRAGEDRFERRNACRKKRKMITSAYRYTGNIEKKMKCKTDWYQESSANCLPCLRIVRVGRIRDHFWVLWWSSVVRACVQAVSVDCRRWQSETRPIEWRVGDGGKSIQYMSAV